MRACLLRNKFLNCDIACEAVNPASEILWFNVFAMCHWNAFSFTEKFLPRLVYVKKCAHATRQNQGEDMMWDRLSSARPKGLQNSTGKNGFVGSMQHVNCTIEIEGNDFSDLSIDLNDFFVLRASSKQIMSKSRGKEQVNGKWDSVKGSNVFKFQLQDTVHISHSSKDRPFSIIWCSMIRNTAPAETPRSEYHLQLRFLSSGY